jgi:hypothetical protein
LSKIVLVVIRVNPALNFMAKKKTSNEVLWGIAILGVFSLSLYLWTLHNVEQAKTWPVVDAVVTDSHFDTWTAINEGLTGNRVVRDGQFNFAFDYTNAGRQYTSKSFFAWGQPDSRWVRREYPIGRHFQAFYNPQDPSEAVVDPGTPSDVALGFTIVFFGILVVALILRFNQRKKQAVS